MLDATLRGDHVPEARGNVRAVVVHNRTAGQALRREGEFLNALSILQSSGWTVEVEVTSNEGHASEIAKEAAAHGADVVVAAGGDGTINDVIQGLAHAGAALGNLPLGTVNVWSREVGYASNIETAAYQMVTGEIVSFDLGRAAERYFLLMAGIGLDAEVTLALNAATGWKQRLGILPYVLRALQVLPRYRGALLEIEIDGARWTLPALMVVVSNTRLYGGVARPNPGAVADDGQLDVRVFPGSGPGQAIRQLVPFLTGTRTSNDKGLSTRGQQIRIVARPPVAVQLDGDPIGSTPIEIQVQPTALRAIIPSKKRIKGKPRPEEVLV